MAVTLIVNPGSSSKKYALYDETGLRIAAHVEYTETGEVSLCTTLAGMDDRCSIVGATAFSTSVLDFIERALNEKIITSATEIDTVGIRVVAPGSYFQAHRKIDPAWVARLRAAANRAPLHVPHTEKELTMLQQALPHAVYFGVSDSAFHATLPPSARHYSLPTTDAAQFDIYRFGYHGLSVSAALRRLPSLISEPSARTIVCHLGSGVGVTAVKNGKSIDTTMGYAPGSGLIMSSRAGDVDTGALLVLMQERALKPIDAQLYLQTKGGLRGLADEADLRLLLDRRAQGDKVASNAVGAFVYQIQKAIGGAVAALGGVDTLVFTATAGERSALLRSLIAAPLSVFGFTIDEDKNDACVSRDGVISQPDGPATVAVVRTNEAEEIWRITETLRG